jgi:hypothetical protein
MDLEQQKLQLHLTRALQLRFTSPKPPFGGFAKPENVRRNWGNQKGGMKN